MNTFNINKTSYNLDIEYVRKKLGVYINLNLYIKKIKHKHLPSHFN